MEREFLLQGDAAEHAWIPLSASVSVRQPPGQSQTSYQVSEPQDHRRLSRVSLLTVPSDNQPEMEDIAMFIILSGLALVSRIISTFLYKCICLVRLRKLVRLL